jgi:uncharacterized protein (TIGR03437 family)
MIVTRFILWPIVLLILSLAIAPSSHAPEVAAQGACTPPTYQGFPSACSNINLRWLNRDPISLIDHYEIYRGGVKIGDAPGSAISFSEPVGCAFAAVYTIKQVMKSGASCQTVTSGNPPHTKPCDMCAGNPGGPGGSSGFTAVSAASFNPPASPGAIVSLFANAGVRLTSETAAASGFPLPTSLAGTQVVVNGVPAVLFYVSPLQINFLMPEWAIGTVSVSVDSNGERSEGAILTAPNPAIFTTNQAGSGAAAALVTNDGRNYRAVGNPSGDTIPASMGTAGNPGYLVLFGTGIDTDGVIQVRIGGRDCPVVWAGPQPQFAGLDQINVRLNEGLRGAGTVDILVLVNGFLANTTKITLL